MQVLAQTFLSLLGKLSAAADFLLLGRLHFRPLQICLLSVWRPHILPIDHYVPINSMIRFHLEWWMDTIRFVHSSSGTQYIPFHGCQSLWMGSSSRAIETILSWLLDRRPIPAPYQYSANYGQLFSTKEIHKIHSLLLCYDHDRQYNSGLLYQQTRRNTFSQPMRRGMENPPLVPGIQYHDQSSSYPRQIQYIGRSSFEIGQASQN